MPTRPLRWTPYTPPPPPLPNGIERQMISTPNGDLELLTAVPETPTGKHPLLFLPGASCSAMCYIHFLPFFREHGYPAYSISTRGRGQSWKPSLLSLTFTFKHAMAQDIAAALAHVRAAHPSPAPILGGHSLGGGLAQYMLGAGMTEVAGLLLLVAAPRVNGVEVLKNWQKQDPDMQGRSWRGWFHPRTILQEVELVHAAFFCKECPREVVEEFEKTIPEFESTATGLSILGSFATVDGVWKGITGEQMPRGRRVLLVAAEKDVLVRPELVKAHAEDLMTGIAPDGEVELGMEEALIRTTVAKSGHHMMRDIYWEKAAEGILDWLEGRDVQTILE